MTVKREESDDATRQGVFHNWVDNERSHQNQCACDAA